MLFPFILLFYSLSFKSQVNLVGNPSFEIFLNCSATNYVSIAKYWNSLDSAKLGAAGEYNNTCYPYVPINAGGFQYPKTGNAYLRTTEYCSNCLPNHRGYLKNRLLTTLTSGTVYCVKCFVNLNNASTYAIDKIGIYLSDASVDTVSYCMIPLTYLNPQIENTTGNILKDTLNWIEVSGTFTATGTEKYLVIGNFKSNAMTTFTPTGVAGGIFFADYYIDDVSVIDYNLLAYAGPDKNINLGDSAFIGRPPEIGLECTWTTGTTTVGTGGGIWVKPTSLGTYSYVVTQNICGNIKTDTVNVNVAPSLISEHTMFSQSIGLFPQPANDIVKLTFRNYSDEAIVIEVLDTNGKTVYSKNEYLRNNSTIIPTDNLSDGIYYLKIKNSKDQFATKKLTVTH